MKALILALSVNLVSLGSLAAPKGAEFAGKFLFTHSQKPKTTAESNEKITKCFKFNPLSHKVLQTYDECKSNPKLASPLEEALGVCTRKSDGAKAYFFEDEKECESARVEVFEDSKDAAEKPK